MNGTETAQDIARGTDISAWTIGGLFQNPNGVLAVVFATSLATLGASYVVMSNAVDARNAAFHARIVSSPDFPTQQRADADREIAPRIWPSFEDGVELALQIPSDRAPAHRTAPTLGGDVIPVERAEPTDQPAAPVQIVQGRPPVMPVPRPSTAGSLEVVVMARGMSPLRAASLPRPTTRPGAITSPAWPDENGPQTSELLAAVSPRPSLRPESLAVRVAADPNAIEVARAEAPGATGLGGVLPSPRGGLFGGNTANGECSTRLARAIPGRPGGASSGSAVMAGIGNGSGGSRDDRLVQQALAGNVPSHIRALHPVTLRGTVGGRTTEVTICVTPDYLAIGSDSDNVRVPLGLPAALRVAESFDMMLPTTSMVDAIYRQADVRIAPSPMTPGSSMSSTNYFVRHDETLDGQFARAGARDGQLVAGHKKDLVIANRLGRNPGRVAIYGWHRTNGNPIQPLSTVHGAYYADYSHGIRLVSRTAFVDGRAVDLRELLTDERYAAFLNSDGALSGATVRMASL